MNFESIKTAMADLDEDTLLSLMQETLDDGLDISKAMGACQDGMELVGTRFENGEYYVGDLIYAGEIMSEAMSIIAPALKEGGAESGGKVILCTVKGDLHDIGKNIVKSMLEGSGFEVIDLGIDVPADEIVKATMEEEAHVVALSGVLTLALGGMKDTVDAFEAAGIRDKVKIIVGGNPVSEDSCKFIGADEWAHSPQKGVEFCKEWA